MAVSSGTLGQASASAMLNSKAAHRAKPADKIESLRKNPMIQEPRRLGSSGSSFSRVLENLLITRHFNGMRGNSPHLGGREH